MLKLIVEDDLEECKARVDESYLAAKDDGKYHPFIISGTACIAESVNKNKRRYPYEMLKREVDKFVKENVKKNVAWGEFEHPDSDAKMTDAAMRERAAIKVEEIKEVGDGHRWTAKAILCCSDPEHKIVGFPRADLAKTYYTFSGDASLMGFSTRGYGELVPETDSKFLKEGCKHVLSSYTMAGLDVVMTPSCGEYANGILESKEFMIDMHGQIVECAMNEYEKMINASARTFDLDKKREIYKSAWDTLLKNI